MWFVSLPSTAFACLLIINDLFSRFAANANVVGAAIFACATKSFSSAVLCAAPLVGRLRCDYDRVCVCECVFTTDHKLFACILAKANRRSPTQTSTRLPRTVVPRPIKHIEITSRLSCALRASCSASLECIGNQAISFPMKSHFLHFSHARTLAAGPFGDWGTRTVQYNRHHADGRHHREQ